jgi:hypothetical protein
MSAQTAGLFTHGVPPDRYQLPHPRLGLPIILLIRRVLLRAFEMLREQGFQLAAANEDQITAKLRSVVENNLRQTGSVRGFSRRFYEPVIRQGQFANYDDTRLTKAPDLWFKLRYDDREPRRTLSEFDGLFVECKPVGASHAAGGKYCDDGLIRFVRGDYAWAMQEGMMLAYARDGRTIADHLIPAMSKPARMTSLATVKLPAASGAGGAASCAQAEAVHISHHRRGFPWPDGKGPATDITVYHLWHQCG